MISGGWAGFGVHGNVALGAGVCNTLTGVKLLSAWGAGVLGEILAGGAGVLYVLAGVSEWLWAELGVNGGVSAGALEDTEV